MKKSLVFLAIFVCGLNVFAQDLSGDLKKLYEEETIYMLNGSNRFVKAGERYRMGFFARNIRKELEISPNAMLEYNKYKRKMTNGVVFSGAAIASLVVAAILFPEEENGNFVPAAIAYGGAISLSFVGATYTIGARNSLSRAVWIRNRDVMFR